MDTYNAIHNVHSALRFSDDDIKVLVNKWGMSYTHIIGSSIACNTRLSDDDLFKIAKCIIGNVNYRNHVPADDNNALIDAIDAIFDKYIKK